jgi:hypothetical protein
MNWKSMGDKRFATEATMHSNPFEEGRGGLDLPVIGTIPES